MHNMRQLDVKQECAFCGKEFTLRYFEDGCYEYVDEQCSCGDDFYPLDNAPSISEWLNGLAMINDKGSTFICDFSEDGCSGLDDLDTHEGKVCAISGFVSPDVSNIYECGLMSKVIFEDGFEANLYPTEIRKAKNKTKSCMEVKK